MLMQKVSLLVRLKIPDVTALTAANALRRSMGYHQLKSLQRADYYGLVLNVDTPAEALELARELADKTNLFVNPNKHVYEVTVGEPGGGEEPGVAHVLVTDPHDGSAESILSALQGRLGYGDRVAEVARGVLWTITLEGADAAEARRVAAEMAGTRSLSEGLLANPHFQEYEVF
jgi:phosphoribosylformylglycinamidine (FGAM) synthase PurS component